MTEQQRRAKVPAYLRAPFQSEYDRLNVDPTPRGVDTRTQKPVSQNAPMRVFHGEVNHPTSRRGRHIVSAADEEHRPPKSEEKPARMIRPAPPPQLKDELPPPVHVYHVRNVNLDPKNPNGTRMPVQVGNHEDQMWFDDELVATGQKQPDEQLDNNEVMNIPGEHFLKRINDTQIQCQICGYMQDKSFPWNWKCPGHMVAKAVPEVYQSNWQSYGEPAQASDDASRWVQAHQKAEQEKEQLEDEQLSLEAVSPGELLVLYKNQVIYRGANEHMARQAVESILLQFQPSTEDIVVLKRVAVDFGVSFV